MGAVVVLCVAFFLCCQTLRLCGRFVLFENQVALNSESNRICVHSMKEYDDMVFTELAEPVRRDWGVSPRGNSRRARLAP